jgi:hypothetical protein
MSETGWLDRCMQYLAACVMSHQRAYTKVVEDLQSITRRFREPLKQDLAFVFDCYRHTRQLDRDLGYSSLTCGQYGVEWRVVKMSPEEQKGGQAKTEIYPS